MPNAATRPNSASVPRVSHPFIADELQRWDRTFPDIFFTELCRLRALKPPQNTRRTPRYFGDLINDIVYARLSPDILDDLKRAMPRTAGGSRKGKLYQMLSSDIGYPQLKEHLGAVIALMRVSHTWEEFIRLLDQHYPRYGDTMLLPLEDPPRRPLKNRTDRQP